MLLLSLNLAAPSAPLFFPVPDRERARSQNHKAMAGSQKQGPLLQIPRHDKFDKMGGSRWMVGLAGKVAVIAGGATGIGAATALRLASDGAAIVIGDINESAARQLAARINADGGAAIAVRCDIAQEPDVAGLIAATTAKFGGFDLIHINAADLSIIGIDYDALEVSLDVFDRTIAVDLRGHLLVTRHALPELLRRGGGAIVYTSSGAAFAGEPTRVSYGIAKAGVNALMRHVAARWGKQGIRSNAVSPGLVLTETAKANLSEAILEAQLAEANAPRHGNPSDIAAAVAFLMSTDGEWINGQVITVDGGRMMR
jgi:NAD(P)-dependent dehydrogenase (short-subunit alcohol dehydrogenase family)